ncbi:MAG: FemAB family XrtA/PEP-CTERM system-associated protein [Pseudomonadota bacterium]
MTKHESASAGGKPVSVTDLSHGQTSDWDAFVYAHPNGTFFHRSAWREIFEDVLGHRTHYLQCHRGDRLTGVLPLTQVKSLLFGNSLISSPFLVYGGPLAEDEASADALVAAAMERADALKVDTLEMRSRDVALPGDWLSISSHVTFRKAILPTPEENLTAIPRKQRAMVRKGIKAGVDVTIDETADDLYATLLECKRNLGTPFFSRRFLQAIKDKFGDDAEILTLRKDKQIICSVMSFVFRDEILPYYGGGGAIARRYYGNDFMYWSVMERAREAGIQIFDYGRSQRDSGAYRFKKHWGFEPTEMHYQVKLINAREVPEKDPNSAKYKHLVNVWKKLPLPIAGAVGPYLAKRLG